jgi:hypothetical protein
MAFQKADAAGNLKYRTTIQTMRSVASSVRSRSWRMISIFICVLLSHGTLLFNRKESSRCGMALFHTTVVVVGTQCACSFWWSGSVMRTENIVKSKFNNKVRCERKREFAVIAMDRQRKSISQP